MHSVAKDTAAFDRLFDIDAKTRRDVPLNFTVKLEDYVKQYYGRAKVLNVMGVKIYFSYETPIGVEMPGEVANVTSESFSPTTSRHKNCIPITQSVRVGPDTFRTLLRAAFIEMAERLKQTRGVE